MYFGLCSRIVVVDALAGGRIDEVVAPRNIAPPGPMYGPVPFARPNSKEFLGAELRAELGGVSSSFDSMVDSLVPMG